MELIIKKQYLDCKIVCPLTRKEVYCRFLPDTLYEYYYNHGYSSIFEPIKDKKKE